MGTYQYEELFEYDIVWSSRKTLTIAIEIGGRIVVKAPSSLSKKELEFYLSKKQNWILSHRPEMIQLAAKRATKKYINGETFLYQGRNYMLDIRLAFDKEQPEISLSEEHIIVKHYNNSDDAIRNLIKDWYINKAKETVTARINYFSGVLGVYPAKVCLRDAKTRWGSCTNNKNIMINWRIIMAPKEVMDYIIVHELCHLIEMNHSKYFWNHVEQIIPDWRNWRNWLKENGILLTL